MIYTRQKDNYHILYFRDTDSISHFNTDKLEDELIHLIRLPGPYVILDLNGINHIDHEGFKVISSAIDLARRKGKMIYLYNVSLDLIKLIDSQRSDKIIDFLE